MGTDVLAEDYDVIKVHNQDFQHFDAENGLHNPLERSGHTFESKRNPIVFEQPEGGGDNLRSGVPYIFCRGGKVRLIQLLDYLSVASPESGLFSDWSRNKKVHRTEP